MANNRFYTSYIIEHDLFQPVIDLFVKNGSRYNLIESAILDLFETVRKARPISFSLFVLLGLLLTWRRWRAATAPCSDTTWRNYTPV